jgi:hypothetical protein
MTGGVIDRPLSLVHIRRVCMVQTTRFRPSAQALEVFPVHYSLVSLTFIFARFSTVLTFKESDSASCSTWRRGSASSASSLPVSITVKESRCTQRAVEAPHIEAC